MFLPLIFHGKMYWYQVEGAEELERTIGKILEQNQRIIELNTRILDSIMPDNETILKLTEKVTQTRHSQCSTHKNHTPNEEASQSQKKETCS